MLGKRAANLSGTKGLDSGLRGKARDRVERIS